jgi:hypothetical protein
MARALQRLVAEKDRFEYQGMVVTLREATAAFEAAERLGAWAENLLAGAP